MQPDGFWWCSQMVLCVVGDSLLLASLWIWTNDQVPFGAPSQTEVPDTDAKLSDIKPAEMESVDTKSDQVNADHAESDDTKPTTDDSKPTKDEPPVKWSTPKITEDMSPNTKQKIMDQRLERKRESSRKWHGKFEKAGVTKKQLNSRKC